MSCLCYAIGLGNVWRFPYLCYKNGGGAFLVAYCIMLIVMGMPIFLLELSLGQYTGVGPDQVFKRIAPLFSGLGYCCLVVIYLITVYYMVIIGWTIFYFIESFNAELGWGSCQHSFNTKVCFSAVEEAKCNSSEIFYNFTCYPVLNICQEGGYKTSINRTCYNEDGSSIRVTALVNRTLSSEEYYNNYILGLEGASWDDFGYLRWQNLMCLVAAWIIGYLCVAKSIKTSGKVVYFTTIFPYVILTILVVRNVTLDGAVDGIVLYLTPQWEKLLEADMWGNAASQTFYSFGIACGSLITLASYNKFNTNCLKGAVVVTAANAFTSVYAGLAIFAVLGFLAKQLDVPVDEVASDGPGLAFIAYPEAILLLPLCQLWAVIFFLMLFVLGIGCQFAGLEAVNTTIVDRWPKLRNYQAYVMLGICFSCFLLGIPMCFNGGIYLFTLLEWNTASWAILPIGLLEIVSVSWVYGCRRFLGHMTSMGMVMKGFTYWFWWTCWVIVAPVACIAVCVFQLANYKPASYGSYVFPEWADAIGLMIGIITLLPLPIVAVVMAIREKYKLKEWIVPLNTWGPQNNKSISQEILTTDNQRT
ncbi:sodium- and chloride-dependent glycine transporter 1-like isoform X2 [Agrilus planipennis]|nr:sodium- and chloride-dependent glycine transporter 1-like isoform X2 [Agrilus planipennis]